MYKLDKRNLIGSIRGGSVDDLNDTTGRLVLVDLHKVDRVLA